MCPSEYIPTCTPENPVYARALYMLGSQNIWVTRVIPSLLGMNQWFLKVVISQLVSG